jgi:predicted RNA-binding protein YlxR (DUF448 family)
MTAQRHSRPKPGHMRPAPSTGAASDQVVRDALGPGPVRTCVGCRGREAKALLVRVVMDGCRIDVDARARRPGRGAYVHRRRDCMERALGKGGFGRGLRTRVDRDHTTALRQSLFALLAPPSPGNLPPSDEPAEQGAAIQSSGQSATDLSTCSPATTHCMPSISPAERPAERMSRPSSEITSTNSAPVASDRATTELTRPAPPFVDEHRQARGQR